MCPCVFTCRHSLRPFSAGAVEDHNTARSLAMLKQTLLSKTGASIKQNAAAVPGSMRGSSILGAAATPEEGVRKRSGGQHTKGRPSEMRACMLQSLLAYDVRSTVQGLLLHTENDVLQGASSQTCHHALSVQREALYTATLVSKCIRCAPPSPIAVLIMHLHNTASGLLLCQNPAMCCAAGYNPFNGPTREQAQAVGYLAAANRDSDLGPGSYAANTDVLHTRPRSASMGRPASAGSQQHKQHKQQRPKLGRSTSSCTTQDTDMQHGSRKGRQEGSTMGEAYKQQASMCGARPLQVPSLAASKVLSRAALDSDHGGTPRGICASASASQADAPAPQQPEVAQGHGIPGLPEVSCMPCLVQHAGHTGCAGHALRVGWAGAWGEGA